MTKERKIEILKDLLIQLSDSANILCTCEADERCEVIEEYIKALEQQPCEDCVSREQAIKTISTDIHLNLEGRSGLLKYSDEIKDILKALLDSQEKKIKALPPVTPTHGTCKNCNRREDCFIDTDDNFYCRDWKRREE